MLRLVVSLVLVLHAECAEPDLSQPSCDSLIYCQGDLLDTVQLAHIFDDSKTFVDMMMKATPKQTLKNFEEFMNSTNHNPTKDQVEDFVNKNFEEANELENWNPQDYNSRPKFLSQIDDVVVRDFARNLVRLWPILARKMKPEVLQNSDKHSLIPVPNGFIIPGGRFTEFYYWDTYWIIQGLLISEMHDSVKGMIENYITMVQKYGFVPNGGRVYYLNRSQPPLLTLMAASYTKYTRNREWLRSNIKHLDTELRYWLNNKTTSFKKGGVEYALAHYRSNSGSPRPESYRQDVRTAAFYEDERARKECYAELKSGAETGWDFSSRWIFDANGGNNANLTYIHTSRVIPVDLNSFLCKAFKELAGMYRTMGDIRNAAFWLEKSLSWQKTIESVLWHEKDGIWYDYDSVLERPRAMFYPSNVAPLWAGCTSKLQAPKLGKRVLSYLRTNGIFAYDGGIPTSLENTGEQWDYPNAWAPLQALITQGLDYSRNQEAEAAAESLAKTWLKANIRGYIDSQQMFEKYDALHSGKNGGGGEYNVQAGFGWTNGFALELVERYFVNKSNVLALK